MNLKGIVQLFGQKIGEGEVYFIMETVKLQDTCFYTEIFIELLKSLYIFPVVFFFKKKNPTVWV